MILLLEVVRCMLLLLMQAAALRSDRKIPFYEIMALSKDIGRRYFAGCTSILYDNKEESMQREIHIVAKMLMLSLDSPGCVHVMSFQDYGEANRRRKLKARCSRNLNVMFGNTSTLRTQFTQLSKIAEMAGPVWLIFLEPEVSVSWFFDDANVPFDLDLVVAQVVAPGKVALKEAYRVAMDHPVRVPEYGSWNLSAGLVSPSHVSLYYRRRDFEGIVFKVGTKNNPPVTLIEIKNGKQTYRGFLFDVWHELENRLNFSSTYFMSVDKTTGILSSEGNWSGLIGMIVRKEVEACVSEFTIAADRYQVVDFLRPLISTRNQLYFKKAGILISWGAFFRPFKTEIWITILSWLFASSISLHLFFRICRFYQLEDDIPHFTLLNSILSTLRALCQQGNNIVPKSIPCRTVFYTSYIVAVILITAYSGALTSYITVQIPLRPFSSWQGLLDDGTYKVEPVVNTAAFAAFANATDPTLKRVYEKLIAVIPKEQLPRDRIEAMMNVCEKYKVTHFGPLYMTDPLMHQINRMEGCDIISMETPLEATFISIVVSKNNQFRDALNHHLDQMLYQGHISRFRALIWPEHDHHSNLQFSEVRAEQILQIHSVLFGGIFLSLVFFCMEKYLDNWRTANVVANKVRSWLLYEAEIKSKTFPYQEERSSHCRCTCRKLQ